MWEFYTALSVTLLVLQLRTSPRKSPYSCLSYYVLVKNLKSSYSVILHQGKILFVIVFIIIFCGRDDIFYRYAFYTWIFRLVYLQSNFLHNCSILLTIKNNSFSTELHPNYFVLLSAGSTEQKSDDGGQTIIVIEIGILLLINRFQINCTNPLL